MDQSLFFIKIDPYTETIVEIEASDSVAFINRQVGSRLIRFVAQQPHGDCAIVDADALCEIPYPPAWKFRDSQEIYFGTALWIYVSEEGQLFSPLWSDCFLRDSIQFLGFTQPHIYFEYEPLEVDDEAEDLDDIDLDDDEDQ